MSVSPFRLTVLGQVQLADGAGELCPVAGARGRALLTALALEAPGLVGSDRLIAAVWGESRPSGDRAALHTLLSRLRRVDGTGLIRSSDHGYRLDSPDTDLAAAERGLARAEDRAIPAAERLAAATAALALWQGEPGEDQGGAHAADELIREAMNLRHRLHLAEADAALDAGEAEFAVDRFTAIVAATPGNESHVGSLMRALDAAGRRSDALRAFAELRERLKEQLGAAPGAELTSLHLRFLAADESAPAQISDSRPGKRVRLGLASATTPLIGREAERATLEQLLATHRLVTVLGPGGLGKTRLGHEVLSRADDALVVAVPLASIRNSDDVLLALATALGIRDTGAGSRISELPLVSDLRGRVLTKISAQPTLMLLDNCEHVLSGAIAWADELLTAAPELRILTTSRAPLGIPGEQVLPLSPLPAELTSGQPGPAVALFCARAEAARPGIRLDDAAVARLCEQLDGLPLAIELAAARVRSLSLADIERRLQNRFALLTATGGNLPDRHRTLAAVIDWSWQLLSTDAQDAMVRLSVFVDGCSAEAAANVLDLGIDPALDLIDALVSQSLLVVAEALDGSLRYRMLETVREYGLLRQDPGANEQRFVDWAAQFARAARSRMDGPEQVAVFMSIEREQDNLVSALRLAMMQQRPDRVVTIFALLAYFWSARSTHSDVLGFGALVLGALRGYRPDAAHTNDAGLVAAILSVSLGAQGGRALVMLRRLIDDPNLTEPRIRALGQFLVAGNNLPRALAQLDEAGGSRDRPTAILANLLIAQFAENHGEPDRAARAGRAAWEAARLEENTWMMASAAMMIAQIESQSDRPEASMKWLDRAYEGLTQLGVAPELEQLDWVRATNLLALGNTSAASEIFTAFSLSEYRDGDHFALPSVGLFGLAAISHASGDAAETRVRFQRSISTLERGADRRSPWMQMVLASALAAMSDDAALGGLTDRTGSEELLALAKRLRTRTLGVARRPGEFLDLPVLGTALVGWAAWALRSPGLVIPAVELHALGLRLRARQDLPAMRRTVREAAAREIVGDALLDAAHAAAAQLSLDEAAVRALAILADTRER